MLTLALTTLMLAVPAPQDEPEHDRTATDIAAFLRVIDAQHIQPPARRVLLTAAIDRLATRVDRDLASWKDRLPESLDDAATVAFLGRVVRAARADADAPAIASALADGISRRLPGGAMTVDSGTARVNDSLASNQYVGIGVILDFKGARASVRGTYFGGPAHRAGLIAGDVIYEVEGVDTLGMTPARFLGYSRDEAGTELVYVVAQPGKKKRKLRITRAVVPRETVEGTERGEDERWRFGLGSSTTAYAKLTDINASTAHELRKAAAVMRRAKLDALVLDLRGLRAIYAHSAALVADQFVRDGNLATWETRSRVFRHRARRDILFDPARTVVLIDANTRGTAEWLAAALRKAGARLVGATTPGAPFLSSRVDVPRWPHQVRMTTAWLLDPASVQKRPLGKVEPDRGVTKDTSAIDTARSILET